jgi:diguanylate cyclase
MSAVSRAAEAIGRRDEKCSSEIGDLAMKMRSIPDLKDLAAIRTSIIDSTMLLKSRVEKMVQEGDASTRLLTAELEEYRSRLEQSETAAALDPLTRLGNRRAFEKHLQARISSGRTFSLLLIDLNDFKSVNDRYGHLPATTFCANSPRN